MPWTVYILACADGTLYTGIALDLAERLDKHAKGLGAKYTRGRGPFKVVYSEVLATKGAALQREAAIKTMPRAGKQALIASRPSRKSIKSKAHVRP